MAPRARNVTSRGHGEQGNTWNRAGAAQGRGRAAAAHSSSSRTIVESLVPAEPPERVSASDKNTDPRSTD